MSEEVQIKGVRKGNPVSLKHIRQALHGISYCLQRNDKEGARLYTSNLLQYLTVLDLLPKETK